MRNKIFSKKLATFFSFGVGIIVFSVLTFLYLLTIDKHEQLEKILTTEKYVYFQKDISNIIYSNINILDGYIAFLSTQKDISKESTTSFLDELLKDKMEYIRNVTVIKDTTIVMAYPALGNESSIGRDLSKVDNQMENVLKVKSSLKPVFQGPVKLVQGGTGYIIRVPVKRDGKYWGQVSLVMDADNFTEIIEGFEKDLNIEVVIENKDEITNSHIYGNKALVGNCCSKFNYSTSLLDWIIYINPKQPKPNMIYINITIFTVITILSVLAGIFGMAIQKKTAKIKYQAAYDQLTGLYNRNYYIKYVPPLFEDAKKRDYKLGVMVLDINKFKSINDNYGHNVGDIVLKDFSKKLKATLRIGDIVFRTGGDEFMILCEKFKNQEALKILERKIKESLDYTLVIDENEVKVSTSIGSALYPDDGEDIDAVIDLADKKMYEDKP